MLAMKDIDADAVVFQPAGPEALDTLTELFLELARALHDPVTPDAARLKIARGLPHHRTVLFRHAGRAIGMIMWADLGDHLFIRNYVVREQFRRRGLGAALFRRLRAEVFPAGLPLRLEASEDSSRAFWVAQGFHDWSTGMRTDPFAEAN